MRVLAEYKKKKVKKVKLGKVPSKKEPVKQNKAFEISMQTESKKAKEIKKNKPNKKNKQTTNKENNENLKVIPGYKTKNKKKLNKITLFVCVLVLLLIIVNFLTPTGIIETVKNQISQTGSGTFPATLKSSNILKLFGNDNKAYILSDTNYEIYNSRGKCINNIQHGFLKPSLCVSESRSLIYDRGGKNYKIANNSEVLYSDSLKESIYSADISRSGVFAFSSKASGYTSQLNVFDKYNKSVFTLFSADNIIADLSINDSGKKVATAEITTSGGEYLSIINIYNFNNSSPEKTVKIEGDIAGSIINLNSCFAVVCKNCIKIINWSNGNVTDCEINGEVLKFTYDLDGNFVYVSGRNNDYSTNNITYYHNDKFCNSFDVNYSVKTISVKGKNIFTLNSENIYCYNGNDGKFIKKSVCEFSCSDFCAINKNAVTTVSQAKLYLIK